MDYTKNNNSGIIYKLAKRSLKGNKGRNIAAVITIVFSVCVVLSLVLITLSVWQMNYDLVKDTYQAIVKNVSSEEIGKLMSDNRLYKVGVAYYLDYVETPDRDIFLIYYNDVMIESHSNVVIEGVYPQNEDEILVSQSYLDMVGQNVDIGDTIQIEAGRKIKGTFKITGIFDDTQWKNNVSNLFFSNSFLELLIGDESIEYNAYLWLESVHSFTADEAKILISQVCEDNNIEAGRISFNSPYFHYIGQSISVDNLLAILLIGSLILFAAAIVIYTIFYISVVSKIREYGQLRTLGATKRQVKRIVAYEGMTLAVIGGMAGVLFGWLVGYATQPDGWNWVNTLWATLAVMLFEIFVVWVSVRTPSKMAGSASPIEAERFSAYKNVKCRIKTRHRKSTPIRIAVLNVIRNPKKAVLTILSLGLCGMLFICAASLQINITAEKAVRSSEFQYGEYKLEVTGGGNNTFSEVQQLNNPLTEDLRKQILGIEGIEDIREWKALSGK
ncbi:ABC transporter permease, partial [Lachnoclostridium sp.]|uniref:ABC transporter permease n=1 Tax=Lachnoclostridium sp. TaxID=2028282 RepID=UPI002898F597